MANIYNLSDTWSDGATTYTSIKMSVTDTASAAASKLIDMQVVGTGSLFSVDKLGKLDDVTEAQIDNINVNGNTVSSSAGNLQLEPYTGSTLVLDGLNWPQGDGTANQMLQTDGAGNLSWGTPAAGYSNADVDTHLNQSNPTSGYVLSWDGSDYAWVAQTGSYGDTDVNANLNTGSATTNQVLSWDGSDYAWVAQTGGDLVTDTTPQLGGALDVNGNAITSASAGNIAITPDTTGSIVLDGQSWPQADGTANQVLQTNGSGQLSWVTYSGATGYGDNDVDLHLNKGSASSGQVLGWNGTDYAWVANSGGGSSYGDADVNTHLNQSTAQSNEVLSWNGTDYAWVAQTTAAALGYTAAATTGTVTNTAGTDATLPAATTTNAGLLTGADKTKLDGIETAADVTDTANVTAAGAVMDSELTDEAAVKAINQGLTTTSNVAFNDLALAGDLQVNGTTTTVGTTNMAVADSLIELSNGFTGTPVNDAGIVIERGTGDNAFIGWDESDDKFVLGTGTFVGTDTGNLTITAGTLVANVEGRLYATGDGTNNGKLDLQCSAGTHAVTLEGPDHSGASSYTLQLPQAAPAAGQLLAQNSANNQLEFVDNPAAGIAAAMALVLG
jgi:hypothetical protein